MKMDVLNIINISHFHDHFYSHDYVPVALVNMHKMIVCCSHEIALKLSYIQVEPTHILQNQHGIPSNNKGRLPYFTLYKNMNAWYKKTSFSFASCTLTACVFGFERRPTMIFSIYYCHFTQACDKLFGE